MMRRLPTLLLVGLASLASAAPASAAAASLRTCVYDPSGATGDAFQIMKDWRAAASGWGADIDLVPYTDEKTAAEDLKAGRCALALLTGVRARVFNRFAGTVEAMGAVESYAQLEQVVGLMASPKAASRMERGPYVTAAVFPAGTVYVLVRDRRLDDVGDLAGKRVATLDFDEAAIAMVRRAGAAMVPADIGTFAAMFNNGNVDVAYAPLTAVEPLELEKGLTPDGGIVRHPLSQLTLQLVGRSAALPEGFAQKSRIWAAEHFDQTLGVIRRAEQRLPEKYWIPVEDEERQAYRSLFRDVRLKLREQGVYDATMLTLLRRIRCRESPERAECAEKLE